MLPEMTDIIREYTKMLWENEINRCIKKTNIRSSHSQVHVGDNNWESRMDKEVYPYMVNSIGNNLSDFMLEHYTDGFRRSRDSFVDSMADNGNCGGDNDKLKESQGYFRLLTQESKLLVFDKTKTPSPPKHNVDACLV